MPTKVVLKDALEIGKRLRDLREKKGVSQGEVAKFIGVSRPTYVSYETGRSRPVRTMQKLSAYFGVSTDYLLTGKGIAQDTQEKGKTHDDLSDKEKEILKLFNCLDTEDQAEIKGQIKGMLRNSKYGRVKVGAAI